MSLTLEQKVNKSHVMTRTIIVNGWQVVQGLCTVEFNTRTYYKESEISGNTVVGVTHGMAYDMLEGAEEIIVIDEYMIELVFGEITIRLYKQIN